MKDSILAQFLSKPLTTGAVWPSSPELSRMLTREIGVERAKMIVELGAGTGAVTGFIAEAVPSDATFFAVELNSNVIKALKKRHPSVKVHNDCASNLPTLLKQEGFDAADVILSGLPWASFSDALQDEILDAIVACLPSGGSFATFAYIQGLLLPTGQSFRKKLDKHFSSVKKSKVVWRNIPPAFVYRCRK